MAQVQTFWWLLGLVAVVGGLFFVLLARRLGQRRHEARRAQEFARDVRPPDETEPS
jgi:hypothetical protein